MFSACAKKYEQNQALMDGSVHRRETRTGRPMFYRDETFKLGRVVAASTCLVAITTGAGRLRNIFALDGI
jgi:hypothetical protein